MSESQIEGASEEGRRVAENTVVVAGTKWLRNSIMLVEIQRGSSIEGGARHATHSLLSVVTVTERYNGGNRNHVSRRQQNAVAAATALP